MPFEDSLVNETAIGYCGAFPFKFPVNDPTPFRQKPFPFPAKERTWLRNYMESQCELGVFCHVIRGLDQDPVFA